MEERCIVFIDDAFSPRHLEALVSILTKLDNTPLKREQIYSLLQPKGLPNFSQARAQSVATIKAGKELEILEETNSTFKLGTPHYDSTSAKKLIISAFSNRVLNNLKVEPYFAIFYSILLVKDDDEKGSRTNEKWASEVKAEYGEKLFGLTNPFNGTKLNKYWDWYIYLGLGEKDPKNNFFPLPFERIRQNLSTVFGEKKSLEGDEFIKKLSDICPELDQGKIFDLAKPTNSQDKRLSRGLSQALCLLHETEIIKLYGFKDSHGWDLSKANPGGYKTLTSKRLSKIDLLNKGGKANA
jgi:hypothetical protein